MLKGYLFGVGRAWTWIEGTLNHFQPHSPSPSPLPRGLDFHMPEWEENEPRKELLQKLRKDFLMPKRTPLPGLAGPLTWSGRSNSQVPGRFQKPLKNPLNSSSRSLGWQVVVCLGRSLVGFGSQVPLPNRTLSPSPNRGTRWFHCAEPETE